MKISVITPSVRPEGLRIVAKCLNNQTFTDFEWLIGAPQELFIPIDRRIGHDFEYIFVPEPEKRIGDYYNLNKCWNSLFKASSGELLVSIVDMLWFPADTLQRLWSHFEVNPKACIGAIGNQYSKVENGKPEHQIWQDPRIKGKGFYEISPMDLELCIASLPRKAVFGVGGVDENFDKGAAVSEKEMCLRMERFGYKFYLDESIEYRALYHPRLSKEWDEKYTIACNLFNIFAEDIKAGIRKKLNYLEGGE